MSHDPLRSIPTAGHVPSGSGCVGLGGGVTVAGREITLEDGRPLALELAYDLLGWSDIIPTVRITWEDYQQREEARKSESDETVNAIA